MYRKVRIQLTILFTLVTSVLLVALLSVSFYLSVRQQFSLQLSSFTGQSQTVVDSINEQNILTSAWLTSKEEAAGFRIYLWDNDVELFHNREHSNLIRSVYSCYLPTLTDGRTLKPSAGTPDISIGYRGIFPELLYYHKQLVKNNSILKIYFLQPLDPLYDHVKAGLILYTVLLISSECLLTLFCWHFTGRLLKPLLDSQISQNRFISGVSHELRTPLAVILSNASACEKAPAAEQKNFFQVIAREGAQMSTMLEQLLTLSRADSHGLTLQIEETDLQTLLLETYENFLPLAGESGHHLTIRLPETEIPLCECDSFRIRQVCHILLHNALSYTPAGSSIALFLADGSYEKAISICVQDNGFGIPVEEQDKIFERFYRGRSEEKGHHGLGLAVAKEITAAHKGTLRVTNAVDGGALFILTLPLKHNLS
ncbi:MAG: HAMP domain-containing histidine kinase [Lachnospiraceae bacterium]|nr:HAMP domain-containing histidine kinase [Lachnospiraceae bacterium]